MESNEGSTRKQTSGKAKEPMVRLSVNNIAMFTRRDILLNLNLTFFRYR